MRWSVQDHPQAESQHRRGGTCDERGVRDDESSGEPEKEDRRHTAEEVSCSRIEEADVGDIPTEDEKVLWRSVERDGFPREDILRG